MGPKSKTRKKSLGCTDAQFQDCYDTRSWPVQRGHTDSTVRVRVLTYLPEPHFLVRKPIHFFFCKCISMFCHKDLESLGRAKGGPWSKATSNPARMMRGGAARSTQWTAHAARLVLAVNGAFRHAHSRVLDYIADPWRVCLFLMSAPPELPVIARERAPRRPCLHALAQCGEGGSPAHASRPRRMLTE